MQHISRIIVGALCAAIALACAATASAHVSVGAVDPQVDGLKTSKRTVYRLRVPNEEAEMSTTKVTVWIPGPVQEGISFRKAPGWKVVLNRVKSGEKDDEGNDVYKTTRATWILKDPDEAIDPGFYGEFNFRFQNPSSAQSLCFPAVQIYTQKGKANKVVRWTDAASGDHPASCLSITA